MNAISDGTLVEVQAIARHPKVNDYSVLGAIYAVHGLREHTGKLAARAGPSDAGSLATIRRQIARWNAREQTAKLPCCGGPGPQARAVDCGGHSSCSEVLAQFDGG